MRDAVLVVPLSAHPVAEALVEASEMGLGGEEGGVGTEAGQVAVGLLHGRRGEPPTPMGECDHHPPHDVLSAGDASWKHPQIDAESTAIVAHQVVCLGIESVQVGVGAVLFDHEDFLPKAGDLVESISRQAVPDGPVPVHTLA